MAAKLTTALEQAVSAEFVPGGEFNVQCDATDPRVIVDVYAKLDAAADYIVIDSFSPALRAIQRYVDFAFVKVGIRGNRALATVNVWSA